jgi:lysine biosynthesis protein LysW
MTWNNFDTLSAECPECDSINTFITMPKVGQIIFCALCGTKLEVAYLRPIMLDFADDDMNQDYESVYEDQEFEDDYEDDLDLDDDNF